MGVSLKNSNIACYGNIVIKSDLLRFAVKEQGTHYTYSHCMTLVINLPALWPNKAQI